MFVYNICVYSYMYVYGKIQLELQGFKTSVPIKSMTATKAIPMKYVS